MAVRTFIYPLLPTAPPVGGATEAKQDVQIIELQGINTELNTQTTELQGVNTELNTQTTELQAINTNIADIELLLSQRLPGSLAPVRYDEIALTYVPSGNGVGEIATVTYKLATVTVKTLTLTYDSSNRLINVV
jgi:hypothetical protein